MPGIDKYGCDHCDLVMPEGWGGYTYVVASNGERVPCPHPGETMIFERVTGLSYSEAYASGLVGSARHCLCFDCTDQFDLDLDRDIKRCPKCSSLNVRSARGAIGSICPRCKQGHIRQTETGWIS